MRYRVQLWRTASSKNPELDQIVRASDIDDAIGSLMKAFDWNYAGLALAFPADQDLKDALPENWRRGVRCRQSGKVSSTERLERISQRQSFPIGSLWKLL